jgi:hypothetical protein
MFVIPFIASALGIAEFPGQSTSTDLSQPECVRDLRETVDTLGTECWRTDLVSGLPILSKIVSCSSTMIYMYHRGPRFLPRRPLFCCKGRAEPP